MSLIAPVTLLARRCQISVGEDSKILKKCQSLNLHTKYPKTFNKVSQELPERAHGHAKILDDCINAVWMKAKIH
jgi:hypothetical protein